LEPADIERGAFFFEANTVCSVCFLQYGQYRFMVLGFFITAEGSQAVYKGC